MSGPAPFIPHLHTLCVCLLQNGPCLGPTLQSSPSTCASCPSLSLSSLWDAWNVTPRILPFSGRQSHFPSVSFSLTQTQLSLADLLAHHLTKPLSYITFFVSGLGSPSCSSVFLMQILIWSFLPPFSVPQKQTNLSISQHFPLPLHFCSKPYWSGFLKQHCLFGGSWWCHGHHKQTEVCPWDGQRHLGHAQDDADNSLSVPVP